MTLQARLTLWSVLLMLLIVGMISALDLGNEMQHQFEATLDRANLLKRVSAAYVLQILERQPTLDPVQAVQSDPHLAPQLLEILTASHTLLEIAVCDRNNVILVDSDPTRVGGVFPNYADFEPLVGKSSWVQKLGTLARDRNLYQLAEELGADGKAVLYVRVVVYPQLIKTEIMPRLQKNAGIALASIIVAVAIAIGFSTIAFRPLGQLGQMLDMVARGEFAPDGSAPASNDQPDEFGAVASKVSLLDQRLRGAEFEYSDLRGNFERLLDDLEDAVLIFGRDRRLMVASGAVEKFLMRSRDDLVGQTLTDIFPPNTSLGLLLAQTAQTGRPLRNRRVPISRDGDGGLSVALLSADILESYRDASDPRGTGLLVRLRDPEATRQIGRQLQTAERLSAISRITGGVAHEVKNPLNAMLMHIELARMKMARGDHEIGGEMEIISREILRLDRVVKTFLDFTRPVELNLATVPLDGFVNEIVELARPQAETNGIQVLVGQQTEGVSISADADLLKQAILNIVVNAIEAMPSGGELRIQSSTIEDEAEIRITDTGPGIPEQLREKIFKLYFTTKKEGSGIGLAMTFRIVQLHDGTIDFSSEPGQGTTFVLRLPIVV